MRPRPSDLFLEYRRPLVVLAHVALWGASYAGAFLLRFDFELPDGYRAEKYGWWWLALLAIRVVAFARFGLFRGMWRYTGHHDLDRIVKATLLSQLLFVAGSLAVGFTSFPRSVFLLEPLIAVSLVASLRIATRAFAERSRLTDPSLGRRLLIVGAGDAGEMLLREILRGMPDVIPVGFLDDDPRKLGMSIHGVRVQGTLDDAVELIVHHRVGEVVIAIPTATGKEMRRIVSAVSREGVTVRTLPGIAHLVDGRVTVSHLREVAIEDLLGRDPVQLDGDALTDLIRDDTVLVTGAGGSIGSELCRQVCHFGPRQLILLEQAENALYEIHRELTAAFPAVDVVPRIADVCDGARLDQIFEAHRPSFVLHAAAHKHVPMMEWNPGEAVKNNVGGTREVAECASRHGVQRFVLISSDKAVNPTSVMGCTKRVAELVVQAAAQNSRTTFVVVRFGNVLGSNGSVLPLFREQIARGGPVTVTHPEMVRFFMTIPEASQLVLEAAAMGESGEIYILDMGEPVRISTLAEDLIRLSGLRPHRDVEIVYTGIRPGEKLFEELAMVDEAARKTRHPKIYIGRDVGVDPWPDVWESVDQLLAAAHTGDERRVHRMLGEAVPNAALTPPSIETPARARRVIPLRSFPPAG